MFTDITSYDEVDRSWGEYRFQTSAGLPKSLWGNQNAHGRRIVASNVDYWIRIDSIDPPLVLNGQSNLGFKFFIEGGSDFPRLRLRPAAGDPKSDDRFFQDSESCLIYPPSRIMLSRVTVYFLPWTHGGTDTSRPNLALGSTRFAPGSFTFSDNLLDLKAVQFLVPPPMRAAIKKDFGVSTAFCISWKYKNPIGHNRNYSFASLTPAQQASVTKHRQAIAKFRRLMTSPNHVSILVKDRKVLVSIPYCCPVSMANSC